KEVLDKLDSYAEISPSGTGTKVFVQGRLPGAGRHGQGLEMYDSGRFFTVTGQHLAGTPRSVEARQEQLAATYRHWFGDDPALAVEAPQPATEPPPLGVIGADAELIRRALAAKNGDRLAALWYGRVEEYKSNSEADLALCRLLAFWTGPDL